MSGYRAISKMFVKNVPILSSKFEIETEITLAALDKKDYPEPEHLTALIKTAIQEGISQEKQRQGNILGDNEEDEVR